MRVVVTSSEMLSSYFFKFDAVDNDVLELIKIQPKDTYYHLLADILVKTLFLGITLLFSKHNF